jgi:UDP-N-acetylmuramoyl-tripeptide--D-alanyl-D-alanine ligase
MTASLWPTPLWSRAEALAATHGTAHGRDWQAEGVCIDSRSLAAGDLFVALAGPNHDGHAFVAAALEAGAAAALVHRIPEGLPKDAPLLVVNDTFEGLRALAQASRARTNARVVGITGSVGKTGTKEMLILGLSQQGATHATAGNLNNHWGVPLTLARMPRDVRFAVIELGMNHPGEITPLTTLVRPHVAIITTVEAVHMEFFPSTAEIADAKAEIFAGLEPGGVAILPRDNRHFRRLAAAAGAAGVETIRSFGNHIDASARLLDCGIDPDSTAVFALLRDLPLSYRIGIAGLHWAVNSLAVLLAVQALGGDADQAARTLGTMAPPKGRGERHRIAVGDGKAELIDESYNASPVSTKAAIATLAAAKPAKGARRIAVLGDMLELGNESAALHAGLAEAINLWKIDLVFTAGPLMGHLHQALPPERQGGHAASADEVAPLVKAAVSAGDVVMVKGSAGSRMGRVVKALLEGCR